MNRPTPMIPTIGDSVPASRFRFARFELQLDERRLLADGWPVTRGGHALDVLAARRLQDAEPAIEPEGTKEP